MSRPSRPSRPSRRAVLALGAGAAVAAGGVLAATAAPQVLPGPLRRRLVDQGPDGVVPDVPQVVRLEQVRSAARGRPVGLFTAVPDGAGDGAGLPVCLVLHGASATTADFEGFGLGRFLTAAVRAGVPPFALLGVDGGVSRWEGGPGDDPQRMLVEEVPRWAAERGLDAERIAVHGWSMGGYGSLLLAVRGELALRAVAVLSPALAPGDAVLRDAGRLVGPEVGVWCGQSDPFLEPSRRFVEALPEPAAVAAWSPGAHTRRYWNRVTPEAFALVGRSLG